MKLKLLGIFLIVVSSITLGCFTSKKAASSFDDVKTSDSKSESSSNDAISLEELANQGDAKSQALLGEAYYLGTQLPQNFKLAIRWLEKSAEQGYVDAQFFLGLIYVRGKIVEKNDKTGMNWLEIAAKQGNAYAQYRLAELYYNGDPDAVWLADFAKALEWCKKSANQGYVDAFVMMGDIIENDKFHKLREGTSFEWYKKAANKGDAYAMAQVSQCHWKGGAGAGKADPIEALKWATLSAAKGNESGIKFRDYFLKYLKFEQIEQGQDRALNWNPSN